MSGNFTNLKTFPIISGLWKPCLNKIIKQCKSHLCKIDNNLMYPLNYYTGCDIILSSSFQSGNLFGLQKINSLNGIGLIFVLLISLHIHTQEANASLSVLAQNSSFNCTAVSWLKQRQVGSGLQAPCPHTYTQGQTGNIYELICSFN